MIQSRGSAISKKRSYITKASEQTSITNPTHEMFSVLYLHHKPRLHGDSDPDPDPDWLRLHGGKLDSNPDSDHLTHVDCDPDSNPDSGPGAHVNAAIVYRA